MDSRQPPGQQQDLEIHQRSDREPALNSGRSIDADGLPAALVIADEEIELRSNPQVQQQKRQLNGAPQGLGMLAEGALPQFFSGFHVPRLLLKDTATRISRQ